jgi:hypothetical protein
LRLEQKKFTEVGYGLKQKRSSCATAICNKGDPMFTQSISVKSVFIKATLLFIVFASFIGCAARHTIPVKRESGVINYVAPQIKQEPKTKYAIAIVSEDFDRLTSKYASGLSSALAKTFLDILNKKGFAIKGTYQTIYDMTCLDKQQSYLAMTPVISAFNIVEINANITQREFYGSKKAEYSISGEMFIKIFEPHTEETLINKRINLSDFKLSKRFVEEWQTNFNSEASKVARLTNNENKARADLLNEFFVKAVNKIARDISQEELLSFERQINELKKQKRY